ncbi:MAG TPA: glycosyltransferase family 39 protein [Isosphaeraceae bacterium]|nr:glycosyltransferase family 39 protein [Isosphaeraceae bacterium]
MEPRTAGRLRGDVRVRWGGTIRPARPLVRAAPRSAMFFPLVVLVAVLPGLYALNSWDLTPPGPWWGLRGLVVLDGRVLDQVPAVSEIKPALEARAFRTVALQPPLYAWLEAVGLALSADRDPRATVLPSYVAGALVVVLVYLHGRLWRGPGLGLIAAALVGFNRNLLVQMQQATPTTLGLAGTLTALLCYGGHLRVSGGESPRARAWGGAGSWTILGGLALGLSLMAVGLFGLACVPVVLLHQAYLRAGAPPGARGRSGRRWLAWRANPSLSAGAAALGLALALAAPWHVRMAAAQGPEVLGALLAPFDPRRPDGPGLLGRLIGLAPATLPLGLFAAVRMVRLALIDETEGRAIVGGVFWVLWLAVAALVPTAWTSGPRPTFGLFLLVPLSLLAASAITDLANRSIPVRTLTWLAPATAVSIAWWISANLRGAVGGVLHGRADATTALGLHLALDLLVALVLITRGLGRWARRRDDRQRRVLGGFLAVVVAVTAGSGIREVWFRHRETDDLLMLRTMILRRDRDRPFHLLAVVSPDSDHLKSDGSSPGGRLRFILRSALPHLPQRDLTTTDELLSLPEGQRLVILAGTEQRLPYAVQSRLGLEAIHPGRSGILDAFATAHDSSRPPRR